MIISTCPDRFCSVGFCCDSTIWTGGVKNGGIHVNVLTSVDRLRKETVMGSCLFYCHMMIGFCTLVLVPAKDAWGGNLFDGVNLLK